MAGGPIGGQGPLWKRGIWVFISCCIVVAIWNGFSHDPKVAYQQLQQKSEEVRDLAGRVAGTFGLDTGDPSTGDKPGDKPAPKKQHRDSSGR